MMLNVFDFFISIMCSFVLFLVGPGLMGVGLFFCSVFISFFIFLNYYSWVSIVVWLTYVSALLVLFLFFVSISPSSGFKMSKMMIFFFFFLVFCLYFFFSLNFGGGHYFYDFGEFFNFHWIGEQSYFSLVLACMLLMCMVGVVKISDSKRGSMRFFI